MVQRFHIVTETANGDTSERLCGDGAAATETTTTRSPSAPAAEWPAGRATDTADAYLLRCVPHALRNATTYARDTGELTALACQLMVPEWATRRLVRALGSAQRAERLLRDTERNLGSDVATLLALSLVSGTSAPFYAATEACVDATFALARAASPHPTPATSASPGVQ
jgi:hypothetical protein